MVDNHWVLDVLNKLDGEKALKAALSRGGDLGDLYWEEAVSSSFVMEDGTLEKIVTGIDTGAALRVVFDDRQAFASSNECSAARLSDLARTVATAVDQGRPLNLTPPVLGKVGPDFSVRLRPETVDTPSKLGLIKRAEKAARGFDSRIKQVKVVFADRVQKVMVLTSDGLVSGDERVSVVFMVQVVAADGSLLQTGLETAGGKVGLELFEENPPEEIAQRAAARAILMLEADEAPSGVMPVVLSSRAGGTMIHEAIGHGLEADLTTEGLSVYSGRIGEDVASPLVTVIDDATMPGRRGSFTIDDEGTPAQKTVLVQDGVLKGFMHDRRSALKMGVPSTGNGRRESYRYQPVVRMTNTLIAPGQTPPEDILAATPEGLLVYKMGGGQVDTVNGNFVFEISEGYLIENGQKGRPVRGATLTGNGPEVLTKIDLVGSDLGFAIGTCGKDGQGVPVADAQPTIRIPEIVVGGRKGNG